VTRGRLAVWSAGGLVVGAAAFFGVRLAGSSEALTTPAGPLVPTTRITRGPLELSVHATGEVRAAKSAMLPAPSVGGTLRILKIASTGTTVKAGDTIVELDPTEQVYSLEQARSELQQAEQEIVKRKADAAVQAAQDKVELLTARFDVRRAQLDGAIDKDLIAGAIYAKRLLAIEETKRRLEQVEGDVKSRAEASKAALALVEEKRAKAELSATRAQQNIDSLVMKAPMDGHVVVRENRDAAGGFFYSGMTLPEYRAGDNTFAGRPLVDVFDLSAMELRIKVGEQDRGNVAAGQKATIEADSLPNVTFNGAVATIAGAAQTNFWEMTGPMRQFDATLKVDQPDARLRPGSSVRVVLAGQRVENVLQLPLQAVRQKEGKPIVYVQTSSGFEARPVKVTYRTESRVGIEGLDEGTVIALVDPQAAARGEKAKSPPAASGAIK
jgi:HlyD family secretion protein